MRDSPALSMPPVSAAPALSAVVAAVVDPPLEPRSSAWLRRGVAQNMEVRRRLSIAAPVFALAAAAAAYLLYR
jgi:hypothetical protein